MGCVPGPLTSIWRQGRGGEGGGVRWAGAAPLGGLERLLPLASHLPTLSNTSNSKPNFRQAHSLSSWEVPGAWPPNCGKGGKRVGSREAGRRWPSGVAQRRHGFQCRGALLICLRPLPTHLIARKSYNVEPVRPAVRSPGVRSGRHAQYCTHRTCRICWSPCPPAASAPGAVPLPPCRICYSHHRSAPALPPSPPALVLVVQRPGARVVHVLWGAREEGGTAVRQVWEWPGSKGCALGCMQGGACLQGSFRRHVEHQQDLRAARGAACKGVAGWRAACKGTRSEVG